MHAHNFINLDIFVCTALKKSHLSIWKLLTLSYMRNPHTGDMMSWMEHLLLVSLWAPVPHRVPGEWPWATKLDQKPVLLLNPSISEVLQQHRRQVKSNTRFVFMHPGMCGTWHTQPQVLCEIPGPGDERIGSLHLESNDPIWVIFTDLNRQVLSHVGASLFSDSQDGSIILWLGIMIPSIGTE